ncbi:MAG: type IX secretion system membrane protein PorP/SprF [Crocinitomicaceae bacterium]|nr:type IX secretion system membrane protein PorP/SprF [Crocinitomicaceae bacterium]
MSHFLAVCFLLSCSHVKAQQDPQFTQYFDNVLYVNPAYAGSREALSMIGIHREQWVGFNGRPRSSNLSVHLPLIKNLGAGATFINDVVGPINQTMVFGDISYTLKFKNSKRKLSFGVKGGVNIISVNTSGLFTHDGGDPELMNSVRNRVLPNFGAGIYYHTPIWFLGISSPKLLKNSYTESNLSTERRHYFLLGGAIVKLNHSWKFRPTTHFKFVAGAPLSMDLSTAFIYSDKWWLGVMHRWQDSFGGFVQFQITSQFKAGLAYDHTATELSTYNRGSFEVLLNYDFIYNNSGIRSPRYF